MFVIGSQHFTVKRPSIRDLDLNAEHSQESITFDSALVSKATSASPLNIEGAVSAVTAVPNEQLLCSLLDQMRSRFGLSLFGVDVVIETGSEDLYVVYVQRLPVHTSPPPPSLTHTHTHTHARSLAPSYVLAVCLCAVCWRVSIPLSFYVSFLKKLVRKSSRALEKEGVPRAR